MNRIKSLIIGNNNNSRWFCLKKLTRKQILLKKYIKDGIYIVIGCLLMAIGTSLFLLPNQLSSGGFAGISTIIYYLFNLPLGTTMLILNIPLLILTIIRVGKETAIKGIIGTIVLSAFIDILERFEPLTHDRLLACIYGGIFVGLGTAIVLKSSASTGGTDLLSYIVRSFKPHYRTSNLIVIVDTAIILLNVIFFKEIEIGLYSAIAIILMGKVIDIIVEGTNFSKLIFIISEKNDKISIEIGEYIKRGTTGIYGKGMFENKDRLVLMCAAGRGDVLKIKHIVQENDKEAFIIITNAREVLGKGFK